MARTEERISSDKKSEQVTTLATGEVPDVKLPLVSEQSNAVKASAVDDAPASLPVAEPAKYGLVLETKQVHDNRSNSRVTLRVGKIVSSKEYDLPYLAKQGLKMRKHEPDQAMPDAQIFVE